MRPQTRRSLVARQTVAATALVVAAALALSPAGRTQSQTFRTTADVVGIDVTVRSNGTPVAGLSASDFVLIDNGVPQTVEAVELGAVPIDVTIVVDTGDDMANQLDGFARQVPAIAALARPDDRIRVMTVGRYVRDLVPAVQTANAPAWPAFETTGPTSAYDALAAALLRPVPSDRRHLVIGIMNGIDGISAIDAEAVLDVARRSGATLNVSQVDLNIEPGTIPPIIRSGRERLDRARCSNEGMGAGLCSPTRSFWVPYDEREFDTLAAAAEVTGGKVYFPSLFTIASASAIFERAFADYRSSYLLRYAPTGVPRAGWHDVEVRLPDHPEYEIRARRGYAVEASPAGSSRSTSAPVPELPADPARAPAPLPESLDEIAAAWGEGAYETALAALRQRRTVNELIETYREAGSFWPASPYRDAVFAIELAQAGLHVRFRTATDQATALLAEQAALVRHPIEPDAFERLWLWTVLAMTHNAGNADIAESMIRHAVDRFPAEPRFALIRALALDYQLRNAVASIGDGESVRARSARQLENLLGRYDEALHLPAVATEAAVRKAWLLHRLLRHDEALAILNSAGDDPADEAITYYRHLIRGRVLDTLGRLDDAVTAYRRALEIAPDAQSASIGLMTGLLRLGRHDEAEAIAARVETSQDADPWPHYWAGDYRFYPSLMARLREGSR